jgi:hypothetical protein
MKVRFGEDWNFEEAREMNGEMEGGHNTLGGHRYVPGS